MSPYLGDELLLLHHVSKEMLIERLDLRVAGVPTALHPPIFVGTPLFHDSISMVLRASCCVIVIVALFIDGFRSRQVRRDEDQQNQSLETQMGIGGASRV
jgi:hypothetical protein